MNERLPLRAALALALLSPVACTGYLDGPSGPGDGSGQGTDEDPSGNGNGGVSNGGTNTAGNGGSNAGGNSGPGPSDMGTGVFGLCEGAQEAPGPRLLRQLTRREYRNTVKDLLFVEAPDITSLPVEARVKGFDNNAGAAAVTSRHIDEYLLLAEKLADEAIKNHKGQILKCDPAAAECAKTFVTEFGLRAFRRPLSSDEVTRYAALFAADLTQGNFDEGLKLAISAMLISPSFLYRSEVGDAQADGTFKLNAYEVASALSYLFWASMPDQALFDAAKNGALEGTSALSAQAERMLKDARAREQLGEFSMQWLRSDNIANANKDEQIYPGFSDSLREAMIKEQTEFFNRVVLDQESTFGELLTADYVIANAELAKFYGLTQPASDNAPVPVTDDSGRGGILTLGAVLASHAHSNESSPIKRGLFVRDRLLCQTLAPPPPSVDATPPGLDPSLTTRERFAKHTSDPTCAGCHQFIDGVGFAFEGFDGIGEKRDVENGLPVDISGEIIGLEGLGKQTKESFSGPRELAFVLAESPTAQACLALQYYRFARGYEERNSDSCSLATLKSRFEKQGLTVKELLVALPQLKSFVIRSAD
jgi:hypothetical protein